jgi:hypothetical protein
VLEALWIWRQYPKQIANDLSRYHRRRIAEWHQGTMSSYEFLELLEFMDDEGAFPTALRGGEYSEARLDIRHLTNEVARLRATMHAVHGGQRYDPPTLLSKAEQRAEAESAEETAERREDFFSFADRDFDVDPLELEEARA